MQEYVPLPLGELGRKLARMIPTGRYLGADGGGGYHRARAALPAADESVQQDDDQTGDRWARSALDLSLAAPQLAVVTRRLLTAAEAGDPRLGYLAEFYGDAGRGPAAWNVYRRATAAPDAACCGHLHIALRRCWATSSGAAQEVYALLMGDRP